MKKKTRGKDEGKTLVEYKCSGKIRKHRYL
jgi:hypothetical protein